MRHFGLYDISAYTIIAFSIYFLIIYAVDYD